MRMVSKFNLSIKRKSYLHVDVSQLLAATVKSVASHLHLGKTVVYNFPPLSFTDSSLSYAVSRNFNILSVTSNSSPKAKNIPR